MKCVMTIALLALLAAGAPAEETEVTGQGFAEPSNPPETDDPPEPFTDEDVAHDPNGDGAVLDATTHYELLQGAVFDNKQHWATTDYIHWLIHGAVLEAHGQVQDKDPAAATIASSEAWGAEIINATVSENEGERGQIRAVNEISFSYSYLVSGRLGEASVQLNGNAYDILGKRHSLHVNAQYGESRTVSSTTKTGIEVGQYSNLSASVAATTDGGGAGLSGETGTSLEAYADLDVNVTTQQPAAGGDNGDSPTVVVRHSITGDTPLSHTYQVFSDGAVVLRARAGAGSSPESAIVNLDKFKVLNQLQVFKSAWSWALDGEKVDIGDGGGGDDTEDGFDVDEPDDTGIDNDDTTEPSETARAGSRDPLGLGHETGGLAGSVRIVLERPADRALVYAVTAAPPGVIDFGGRDRLVVPAGARLGSIRFHGAQAGTAAITLRLLDEAGEPTDSVRTVEATCASLAATASPRLWAQVPGKSWHPGRGVFVRGLPGRDVGPLRIGRTGFAGLADTDTVLTVTVEDPAGILSLPETLTIPAGATSIEVALPLGLATGRARVDLQAGDEAIAVDVECFEQAWRVPADIRVPAGASVFVPVVLSQTDTVDRLIQVTAGPGVAVDADSVWVAAGERVRHVRVRGIAVGSRDAVFRSDGLPDLAVAATVVPATVSFADGALTITGLDGTQEGTLRIETPAGVAITGVEIAPEAADYLVAAGAGTAAVELTLAPSPDTPSTLTLPLSLDAATSELRISGSLAGEVPGGYLLDID